jgi:hypothetical protein
VSPWSVSAFAGERLRVELRPGSVELVRRAALARPRILTTRAIEAGANAAGAEGSPGLWRAAVDVLAAALREQRGKRGRVEIVLSDHFVRYLVIPWSGNLVGDSERLGYARLCFRDVYGHLSDGWDVCLDEQPAGQGSFACAVDRLLASALRDVVARAGARLESLTPSLADCINRHRAALKAPEFCLAAAEPGRISLAFRSPAGWQAVRSRRIDDPLPDTLPTLLKQEAVVGAAPEGGVLYLCAHGLSDVPHFTVPGWRIVRLAGAVIPGRPASSRRLAPVGS